MFGYKSQRNNSIMSDPLILKSFGSSFVEISPFLDEVLKTLIKICKHRLTAKQKKILIYLYETKYGDCTFSKLALKLSKKLRMPLSTVKHVLRTLRECGLILAGDQYNKGSLARLSKVGEIVAEELIYGVI